MKNPRGMSTRVAGENLGHERRGHGPFAAHPHRDEEAQYAHLPKVTGETGQPGEHRIHQDGYDHRGAAAPAITQPAKKYSAECAAREKHPKENVAPVFDFGGALPGRERRREDIREHLATGEVENPPG